MIWIGLVALLAFVTEGAIGFGGTVIAACLGAQLVPLAALIPAFVVINLALSGTLIWRGRDAIAWRVLATTIAPAVGAGAVAGLALAHVVPTEALARVFGGFVAALAALQLARPTAGALPPIWERAFLVAGGIAHGLFGTGGPLVVYVTRRRLADKRAFRATLAVLWFALNIALIANFAALGRIDGGTARLLAWIGAALLPGLVLGERLHRKLDARVFERAVWVLLLGAGLLLALR